MKPSKRHGSSPLPVACLIRRRGTAPLGKDTSPLYFETTLSLIQSFSVAFKEASVEQLACHVFISKSYSLPQTFSSRCRSPQRWASRSLTSPRRTSSPRLSEHFRCPPAP